MAATALYVGRFQPLHNGHLKVIKRALHENSFLIIGLGSSNESRTSRNPFNTAERRSMIKASLKEEGIVKRYSIVPIPDINDHKRWVKHVEGLVGQFDMIYCGNDLTKELFDKAGYKTVELPRYHNLNATKIRKAIVSGKEWKQWVPKAVYAKIRRLHEEKMLMRVWKR